MVKVMEKYFNTNRRLQAYYLVFMLWSISNLNYN